MRFAVSGEQADFAHGLRRMLAAADVPTAVRAWSDGDCAPGRKVWNRLGELGLTAIAIPAEHGGLGAGPVDLVLAFTELGRAAVPGPYVESVAVLPALLAGTPAADRLGPIAAGTSMATLAVPPSVPCALDADLADEVYLLDAGSLHRACVAGAPVRSVDHARRLGRVAAVGDRIAMVDGARAVQTGTLATAAQIFGAGLAVVDLATDHAKSRTQFGRPIGSFQAVKHMLADAHVGLDIARPLLFGAALAVAAESPTLTRDVSAAKVACTDAAYRASRVALQVHGAIGYTSEYELALWLTKIRALVSAWGTQSEHRARVLAAIT